MKERLKALEDINDISRNIKSEQQLMDAAIKYKLDRVKVGKEILEQNSFLPLNKINKDYFPDGPWKTEPDCVEWIDEETKYACMIKRTEMGYWTGYVKVNKDHPVYNRESFMDFEDIDVHGRVTYFDTFFGETVLTYVGFDCGHAYDLMPLIDFDDHAFLGVTYKDIDFVKNECVKLAKQLKAMEK